MSTNKAIYAHKTVIRYAAMDLLEIAGAADLMGNHTLSSSLQEIAYEIEKSAEQVSRAYSDELYKYLDESQKAVGDTLMALLGAPQPSSIPNT